MRGARTLGLLVLPAVVLLLLAAHFFRAGLMPLTVVCLLLPALLFVREPWVPRVLQATLALGTLEWLRTAWVFATHRIEAGQPYIRLLVILGSVALVTGLAAAALRAQSSREHFRATD